MPINKRGGKGFKRGKKITGSLMNNALTYKDTSQCQEYAKVMATLGDCRLSVELVGVEPESGMYSKAKGPLICKVPGSFRKKIFINKGDYVLVSVREYQTNRVDVLTKYNHNEALTLMKQGEIPMEDSVFGSEGSNTDTGFDIVADIDENKEKERTEKGIGKGDDWFNSLLPPTDSDSEDDKRPNNLILNDKAANNNFKSEKSKGITAEFQLGPLLNEKGEIEDIDLETL